MHLYQDCSKYSIRKGICNDSDDMIVDLIRIFKSYSIKFILTSLQMKLGGAQSVAMLRFCARFIQITATEPDFDQLTEVK